MNVSFLKYSVYLSIYTAQHPLISSFQASLRRSNEVPKHSVERKDLKYLLEKCRLLFYSEIPEYISNMHHF